MYKKLFLLILILFIQHPVQAATSYPKGDGKIRVFNYHLNEFAEIQFRSGDKYVETGLQQFNQLLRSRDNSEIIPIDPRLLDLIDHLQDHFQADTIEIISGYRRKEFNENLAKGGRGVSPVSLHTQGEALDIHIDEIQEESLRDYLIRLNLGGVGYYGPLDFVHIDTGPVKTWEETSPVRKLVGVLNPSAPVQLTSDKNDYLPGEDLKFTWDFSESMNPSKVNEIKLEHFWRGKWIACEPAGKTQKTSCLPSSFLFGKEELQSAFGKYRWVFRVTGKDVLLSSNEFYLKKM